MFGRFFHDVIDFYLLFGAISFAHSLSIPLCDVYLSSFWHQWCHHLTFIRVLHHILYRWKESERWLQLANVACLFSVRWKALFAYLQIWLMVFQVTFIDFVALKWHLVLSSTASIFLFVHRVSFKVESAVLFFVVGMAWARAFEAVERTVDSFNFFFRFFFSLWPRTNRSEYIRRNLWNHNEQDKSTYSGEPNKTKSSFSLLLLLLLYYCAFHSAVAAPARVFDSHGKTADSYNYRQRYVCIVDWPY